MPRLDDAFPDLLEALFRRYGHARTPGAGRDAFEALAAAVLGRALDDRRLGRALDALRNGGLLEPQALAESAPEEASDALRVAGAAVPERALMPLRRLARWLVDRHHSDPGALIGPDGEGSTSQLREELLGLNGVGPATADTVLLFALGRPVYPLDRATYRVLVRHGWADPSTDYDEARDLIERESAGDPATLATLAVAFERLGRDHCRATVAKCERCPLRPFLPEGGPIDPQV